MILVTGGTGLVGSHLLPDLIKSGYTVRATYRSTESLEKAKKIFAWSVSKEEADETFKKIEWVKADITDIPSLKKAFTGIKKVYHCAAYISFDPSEDQKLRKTNIEGTANVVNFCIKEQVEKLCYVSSIATFDKKPGESVITESSHWNKELDHSMYAITKYGAEMEVWRASQEGIPVVIVNPGVIIGPGSWESGSGPIFKKIDKGLNYYFPKVTGFVGVEDVVKGMRLLMESSSQNQQFIMVAENRSFRDIFNLIADSLERPRPRKKLKPWMVFTGWLYESTIGFIFGRKRQLNRQSVKKLYEDTFYSSDKIKSTLDFQFTGIKKEISRTSKAFKKDFAQ